MAHLQVVPAIGAIDQDTTRVITFFLFLAGWAKAAGVMRVLVLFFKRIRSFEPKA
jgi:hypothetical protein